MAGPELEEQESRWETARSGLLALVELAIVTVFALIYVFAPLLWRVLFVAVTLLLIALFAGSPSDFFWWVAAAIAFLAVVLFCIRKFMQG